MTVKDIRPALRAFLLADASLSSLVGAWDRLNADGSVHLVAGEHPVTPARVFG